MATSASIGHSTNRNPDTAGREAAGQALAALANPASLLLVFATAGYDPHVLIPAIASAFPNVPMAGCSAEGVIAGPLSNEGTHAVTVLAVASDRARFDTLAVCELGADPVRAATLIADRVRTGPVQPPNALLLFPDSLTANITRLLDTLADKLPPNLKVVGGAAGDMMKFQKTWQYHDGRVLSDAVAAVIIGGAVTLEHVVSHGCDPIGLDRTVTRSDGRSLLEIDGQPAWTVFNGYIDSDGRDLHPGDVDFLCFGQHIDPVPFYGDRLIRVPFALDKKRGALLFSVEIPEGSQLTMTRRVPQRIVANAVASATRLQQRFPDQAPAFVLQLDCAGRGRALFGERCAAIGLHPLQDVLGHEVPWTGCYTFGELASLETRPVLHQYSVVLCALYDLPIAPPADEPREGSAPP